MGFVSPHLPDLDVEEWKAKPRAERTQAMAQHWASHGFGTPYAIYVLYAVKIGLYMLGGLLFAASTPGIGSLGEFNDWWFEPVVFQKVIIWTLLFEVLGFGCGFGPLTLRFLPPLGTFLYWLRPGTIRLPPWPGRVPGTAGTYRTVLDIALYLAVIGSAVFILLSPADRTSGGYAMIEASRIVPLLIVLPILGLRDKTIFLAARSEHYWVTGIVLMFPFVDMILAAKLIMIALWWGAATSKVNQHFPFVVSTMISNAPFRPVWFKRMMWRDVPNDIRPSRFSEAMAHGGTVVEYTVPLILLLSSGGWVTTAAVIFMMLFHLHILSAIPMGVPLEWNVMMMFGTAFLFGHYSEIGLTDAQNPLLVYGLIACTVGIVIWGNFKPHQISFLPAMRYYAGNWPTSTWLFTEAAEQTFHDKIIGSAPLPHRQLAKLYPPDTVDLLMGKGLAFRALHTHGRVHVGLQPLAAADHEDRVVVEGELVAGVALGYNFGDGHLHDEQLLAAVQERCQFAEGEVRVIMIEAQPFGHPVQHWRIVDAATGVIAEGDSQVSDMVSRQPWDGSLPFDSAAAR